ncbi:hypothetical protein [Kribbella sp. NPDC048915]|uniref:hypothetical protein n=1 Tax=Kribbella sp. NPDC048915 TaxID=3155148 RepID=UPI00340A9495
MTQPYPGPYQAPQQGPYQGPYQGQYQAGPYQHGSYQPMPMAVAPQYRPLRALGIVSIVLMGLTTLGFGI